MFTIPGPPLAPALLNPNPLPVIASEPEITAEPVYGKGGVAFGENHTIQSFGYNTFIGGGLGNTINSGANRSGMLGGSSNTLNGQVDTAIVGGTSNTVSHQNSVILGGSGLATTKNDEAVVEKFLISGSASDVFVIANYSALNYADDTAAAAGGVPLGGVYRNGNFLMIRIV